MNKTPRIEKRPVLLYNLYRLVVLTSLLVSALIIQLSSPDSGSNLPFYYLIFGAYGFSAVFFALYTTGRFIVGQAYALVVFDLLLITAFVYISGGIESSMYFMYLFPIIAASLVISGRAGFQAAAVAAVLFGLLVDGLYFGFIAPFQAGQAVQAPLGSMLVTIFIAWGVFFAIAAMMSYLSGNLRKTQKALAAAQKELLLKERLSEAGRVSASLAHEIRNPLAAISGSVQVLKKDLVLSAEQRGLMDIVLKESERVSHSLDQFLDFALPSKQVFSMISLPDILDETLKILRSGGELNGKVEITGNFLSSDIRYYGNAGQFKQIFWNLIKNSLKAMPEGGCLRLDMSRPRPKEVRIAVADTGRGMTAQDKEHLFEPFYSGFATGRGLGLAVVRKIVDDYDGRIDVRSEPGQGTEILITLPRAEGA
ncbi:MAG TPA: ATP-binding protein [Acidobacteriota bacterium]|nr:ATP-binding protein [Acidobacteriota bacterium]